MNELSLFTGIGGGLLGTKLLGWRCIGAVEIDKYCCQVLNQRIEDGCFESFPIWNIDIREFNARYAGIYTGMVDVITAGFPCQPFSVAGKGKAEKDDRNMWPETKRAISIIRPAFVFLENVPGLLAKDYALTIFNDLAEIGYSCLPPLKLGADDVGANHRRKRVWFLAVMADSASARWRQEGCSGEKVPESEKIERSSRCREIISNSTEKRLEGQITKRKIRGERKGLSPQYGWWCIEPAVGRVANGVPNRVDRLKAIGNAQVPAVVKKVWELLINYEHEIK